MKMLRWQLLFATIVAMGCGKGKPSELVAPGDTNPPAAISDLTVSATDATSVVLGWTAPGNDSISGSAASYEIRYGDTDVVSQSDWSQWTVVANPPTPQPAGTRESFAVTGISTATQFVFGIKAKDGAGNISGVSNAVLGRTAGYRTGPVLVVSRQDSPYAQYSENGGRTWKNASVTGTSPRFGALVVDPFNHDRLYATEPIRGQGMLGPNANRIWRSNDRGQTWSAWSARTGHFSGGCQPLELSASTAGLMYVTTIGECGLDHNNCCDNCTGTLEKSTDGGVTWRGINVAQRFQVYPPYAGDYLPFNAIAVDPTNGSRIYAGGASWRFTVTGGGTQFYSPLVSSTNGGTDWSSIWPAGTGDAGLIVYSISISPSAPSRVLLASNLGIYLSENFGANWTSVSATSGHFQFLYDPSNPLRVYTQVAKSLDGGQTWSPMPTPTGGQTTIGFDTSRHELYTVGTGGAYRSADAGVTWSKILTMTNCTSIAVLPDPPGPAVASPNDAQVSHRLHVRRE